MDNAYLTKYLDGGPGLNTVFLSLSIISVLASIYFFLKSKKTKKPFYLQRTFPIIEDSLSAIDGLDIRFGDERLKRLTLSKISFWNSGHATIEWNDVASKDIVRIELPEDEKIISAKVEFVKRDANNISVHIDGRYAFINFDFIDFGDGALIELYHTAPSHKELLFKGTIKGSEPLKPGEYGQDILLDKILRAFFSWIPGVIGFEGGVMTTKDGFFYDKVLPFLMSPIAIPIVFICSPIDYFCSIFLGKIPKEYKLDGRNVSKK